MDCGECEVWDEVRPKGVLFGLFGKQSGEVMGEQVMGGQVMGE